jgi:hypothetical protein
MQRKDRGNFSGPALPFKNLPTRPFAPWGGVHGGSDSALYVCGSCAAVLTHRDVGIGARQHYRRQYTRCRQPAVSAVHARGRGHGGQYSNGAGRCPQGTGNNDTIEFIVTGTIFPDNTLTLDNSSEHLSIVGPTFGCIGAGPCGITIDGLHNILLVAAESIATLAQAPA